MKIAFQPVFVPPLSLGANYQQLEGQKAALTPVHKVW